MIDLAALASLFFEASKEWSTPTVARFGLLDDAKKEDVVQKLISKGIHYNGWMRRDCVSSKETAGVPLLNETK
jgi:hypothetical protein